jgi:UDP-N-acetylglucosamine 3-dehydrogenase
MAQLRVATIGCGSIAQELHLPGYQKNRRARIVACTDPDPRRWKEVREQFGVQKFYRDYREMLDREELDAVSVCSPNKFHCQQALAAIDKGLHVLCEKPMTLTNAESARVIAAAKKAGRVFMVGFTHRLLRGNMKAREIIRSGALGEPFMVRVRFAHGGPFPGWAKTDWFYNRKLAGGGALLDMGIHAFDLVRFFLGDVARVSASVKTIFKPIEVDDNAVVTLEFKSGALGYIEVGWTSLPGFNGAEIYCRKGNIVIDYANGMKLITGAANPSGRHKVNVKKFAFRPTQGGWSVEMDYFIDCIRKGRKPEMDAVEGAAAVKLSVASYESARTGRRIAIK